MTELPRIDFPAHVAAAICERYGATLDIPGLMTIIGLSRTFSVTDWPLNGLRHPAEEGTNGWYVWSGDVFPTGDDSFKPVHLHHVVASHPNLAPYFGLGPGWRFLIAPGHEDVWYDASLLDI